MANCRSDVGGQIKQLLTMREVVERYGFTPDRSGYIQCPFHQGDNHGSLKIYPDDRGWHCFRCGAGGTVIDFVMKLFDISFRQAIVRLSSDFNLNLMPGQATSRAEQSAILEARRREAERKDALDLEYREKASEHCYWWNVMKYFAPAPGDTTLHPLFAEALRRQPILEYWLDENIGR
jgi:DNA primase